MCWNSEENARDNNPFDGFGSREEKEIININL